MKSLVERAYARRRGEGEGDEGFTLIELLVVLLIIGILLAIAIPTFLSVTKGANNTAAQANLQTALTGADTFYTDSNQTYTGLLSNALGSTSSLTAIDTGISYTSTGASKAIHTVSIAYSGQNGYFIAEDFSPGTKECWGVLDLKAAQGTAIFTETKTGTYFFVIKNQSSCTAATTQTPTKIGTSFPPG